MRLPRSVLLPSAAAWFLYSCLFPESGDTRHEPVPAISLPDSLAVNIHDTLELAASSRPHGGAAVAFHWALDGGEFLDSSRGPSFRTAFHEAGARVIRVKARNAAGGFSMPESAKVIVTLDPPVVSRAADTVVSAKGNLALAVKARDTNAGGGIRRYLWDLGADGWDDSGDRAEKTFVHPAGGRAEIVWGARDDDGLLSLDTLSVLFSRPPESLSVAGEGVPTWTAFSLREGVGVASLGFSAIDPDLPYDTMTYRLTFVEGELTGKHDGASGIFTLFGLRPGTQYRWKAVARDRYGDSVSAEGAFIAPSAPSPGPDFCVDGSFVDTRDSTRYGCVAIGSQIWMSENLRFRRTHGAVACTGADTGNCGKYGGLYGWRNAVTDAGNGKDACPVGWHLPSKEEWDVLSDFAGGEAAAGAKLKSRADWNGTDDFGFSALPAGEKNLFAYSGVGEMTVFWSSSYGGSADIWELAHVRSLTGGNAFHRLIMGIETDRSIRCLKD